MQAISAALNRRPRTLARVIFERMMKCEDVRVGSPIYLTVKEVARSAHLEAQSIREGYASPWL